MKKGVPRSHPIIKKKVDKSLKSSIEEGSFAAVYNSVGISYITPFALAMQATASQIGILGAIATLVPAISQLGSCKLMEKFSRKKIIITGILLRTLMWIPLMLTALLFFNNISYTLWILIGIVGISYSITGLVHPAWFSLMGSLVPEKERGKYFSKRSRYNQFFGVVSMILSAIFLDVMKEIGSSTGEAIGYTFLGFATLFTIAMVVRFYCVYLFTKHYEPKLVIKKKDHYKLIEFIKTAKESAFGRFALFNGSFYIAIGIASPFFAVYMLKELGYTYTWFMTITIAATIFQIFFLKSIGKFSDRYGNIVVTKISTTFIALTPLAWAVSFFIPISLAQKVYLILIAQLINGIGWGGYNIATANYVYDSTKQEKQGYALAYMNLFNGLGFFIGALIGSAIVKADYMSLNIIVIVFLASFIARALVVVIGTNFLKEVRHVKKFKAHYLISQVHPIREALNEIHHIPTIKHPHSEREIHHI